VPFAHALEAAGHEVTVACADCFRPDVEATGLVALPAGIDWRNDLMTQSFPDAPPPGPARMPWNNALWRYTTARAMVPDLLAIAEGFRLLYDDDHVQLAAESVVYDALYRYCQGQEERP